MGAFPYENMGCNNLENTCTRMTCMQLQHSRCYIDRLAFKLSKLRFRGHSLFDGLIKIGCGGCNSRRYGSPYFVKCKNDT